MRAKWLVLTAWPVLFLAGCDRSGYYWPGHGPGMVNYGFYGGYMWFLILILAVILAYVLVRAARGGPGGPREDSALEILKRRYARGEISREEYLEMKRELES